MPDDRDNVAQGPWGRMRDDDAIVGHPKALLHRVDAAVKRGPPLTIGSDQHGNIVFGEVTDADIEASFLRPDAIDDAAASSDEDAPLRERIARMISPDAWRRRGEFQRTLRGEGRFPADAERRYMLIRSAERRVDGVVAASLQTADRILGLPGMPGTGRDADTAASMRNEDDDRP